MNVVFLSPHFPPNWFRFVVALRATGATTLGIADVSDDTLRPELRAALHGYYRVDSLENYDQLVRAIGWFIHRHGRIDRLDSLNEHWLETEAGLRTDFNIPGIDRRQIAPIKRKSLMKERFVAAGLDAARGRVCPTPASVRAFVREVGYPVVAKPDVGVGAAKTFKLDGDDDIERYLREKLPVDYIVEEYITGELMSYDGMTDRVGNVVFDTTLVYNAGVMDLVNDQLDLYYWIPREMPDDLRAVGQAMARAFDVRERPFHFEIFRRPDGTLAPLEVNIRPPGGFTVDMWNYGNDFDFYREWANVVVHGRFEAPVTRRYACIYIGRRDGRTYSMSHEQVLRTFADLLVMDVRMSGVFAGAMGDQGYVLRHPELEPLFEAARAIHELAAAA